MRGTLYTQETKRLVEQARSQGKSYSEITRLFKVPKSTLSTWLNKKYASMYSKEKQLAHLAKARPFALAAVQRRIEQVNKRITENVASEFKKYPLSEIGLQKSILASLYWAEGAKSPKMSGLMLANTDPKMIRLFATLLRKCYPIDERKFRVRLHVHYYHPVRKTRAFWSKIANVPLSQFNKVYLKKRSLTKRFRKNFMGICFLKYSDSNIRKELLAITEQLYTNYCKE